MAITDEVLHELLKDYEIADVQLWQNRPLEEVYPIVYFDALWGSRYRP